jgi:hypothetical protein
MWQRLYSANFHSQFQQVLLDVDELTENGFSESHSMDMRLNNGLECLPDCMVSGLALLHDFILAVGRRLTLDL